MRGNYKESNKKRVDLIAANILDLNPFELRYMVSILKSRAMKKVGIPRDGLGDAQEHFISQPGKIQCLSDFK